MAVITRRQRRPFRCLPGWAVDAAAGGDGICRPGHYNIGPAAFRALPKHGFVYARLVPIGSVSDAWLVSGSMRAYRKSDAAQVAEVALELATRLPDLVHRNPGRIEQAWEQMRAERTAFVEFFAETIGVIYDEIDGLNFYNNTGGSGQIGDYSNPQADSLINASG
jgi:hypothetical protein